MFGKGLTPFFNTIAFISLYSITCIQRPLKGSNESGLLQVFFKCRFYQVDLRRGLISVQWSLKAGGLLVQVVSNTGLTVHEPSAHNLEFIP